MKKYHDPEIFWWLSGTKKSNVNIYHYNLKVVYFTIYLLYAFKKGSLKNDNVGVGGLTLNGISHEKLSFFNTSLSIYLKKRSGVSGLGRQLYSAA